jgi:chorismate mutase/prephenate dehydrogenase
MNLENLRDALSDVDRQIIDLIAERQRIVGDIGQSKLTQGTATRDFAREKDVIDSGRAQAEEIGVDPDLAENILTALIRSSLASQERDRVIAEGKGNGRRVLVIGGAGKMGGWFVNFFASQGFETTIADASEEDAPGVFRNWTDAGVDYDVIVVATPLAVSGRILAQLAVLKPPGLVFDIGSLKTPLIDGLRELRQAGCKVMGLDDHDRLIAYVLGLSHALNIAFFTALAESGEAAPRLARMSSTTFDSQLLVSGDVAHDNPHLYFEIQHLNRFGLGPLDALVDAAARIRELVASGDEQGFVDLMQRGRDYLALRS